MPAEGKGKRESTEFGDRTVTVSTGPLDPKDDPNQHPLLANVPTQGGCKFLDPCQLKKTLGRGGMGAVYLGWHPRLNVFRAIKVLNAELAADADYLERFEREARTAARIEHENLVRVFDVRECRNVHYIIMEYVEGENLDILVQREGPFPIDEALAIIRECARGLAAIHLHESPIAHRDIKPANIMRSRDGVIKITDLGLAKELSEESQTLASVVAGTPNYMPREQWQGLGRVGPPGDVFALGATLYYLLAGEHAFYSAHPDTLVRQQDVRRKIVEGELPDFQARIPGLFPELKELLIRCLNRDPDARFAHGGALLTEGIEPVIAAAEALAAAPPPVRKPRSRLQGALAAAVKDSTSSATCRSLLAIDSICRFNCWPIGVRLLSTPVSPSAIRSWASRWRARSPWIEPSMSRACSSRPSRAGVTGACSPLSSSRSSSGSGASPSSGGGSRRGSRSNSTV